MEGTGPQSRRNPRYYLALCALTSSCALDSACSWSDRTRLAAGCKCLLSTAPLFHWCTNALWGRACTRFAHAHLDTRQHYKRSTAEVPRWLPPSAQIEATPSSASIKWNFNCHMTYTRFKCCMTYTRLTRLRRVLSETAAVPTRTWEAIFWTFAIAVALVVETTCWTR